MKRKRNLYQSIISIDNLKIADINARRGKKLQKSVIEHDKIRDDNINNLNNILTQQIFKTSEYKTFTIKEPKQRLIYRLPYFPDRILHHAIMNITKPIFESVFTKDTYSCIKGKGIHKAVYEVKTALKDKSNTKYFLKIDIKKFYPNINHNILKGLLRKKFKDKELLNLMDGIIDSAGGLPIGNYLSQYLANFYLSYFDHWVKEEKKVIYYFRYADDMVFFADNKLFLHKLLQDIKIYLKKKLDLEIKDNHCISPLWCGLDFLGYVFKDGHTRVRKRIKQNCARKLNNNPSMACIHSYLGWFKHANAINLQNKLIYGRV